MSSASSVNAIGSRSLPWTIEPSGWATRANAAWSETRTGSMRSTRPREPIEVALVEPGGGAEREPDTVQADRIAGARLLQDCQRGAAIGEEILGMDLDEAEGRPPFQHRLVVRLAQPDADVVRRSGRRPHRHGVDHAPYFFIATVASSAVMPPIFLQVPAFR
jgi:hypothetical protein